jgi:hypothetical protein
MALKDAYIYPFLLLLIAVAIALAGCAGSNDRTDAGDDDDASDDDVSGDDDDAAGTQITAKFTASAQAKQYDIVIFDASGSSDPDGKPLNYSWDFDLADGISADATGRTAEHAFTSFGQFTVTLSVTSNDGRTATTRSNITITESLPSYEDITLDEGNTGTIFKTPDCTGGCAGDVKKHWNMPEHVLSVESTFSWNDSAWQFEITLGTGECPDNGIPLTAQSGDGGSITVAYSNATGDELETGQWFVHVKIANPEDLPLVASCAYSVTLRIYYIED